MFNLGWHELHIAAKAKLAGDAAGAGRAPRRKRPYDNRKRKELAVYKRKGDAFKNNGLSESRLIAILDQDACYCLSASKLPYVCVTPQVRGKHASASTLSSRLSLS